MERFTGEFCFLLLSLVTHFETWPLPSATLHTYFILFPFFHQKLTSCVQSLGDEVDHGPILLAWSILRQLGPDPQGGLRARKHGNAALELRVFQYLSSRLQRQPFCGKTVCDCSTFYPSRPCYVISFLCYFYICRFLPALVTALFMVWCAALCLCTMRILWVIQRYCNVPDLIFLLSSFFISCLFPLQGLHSVASTLLNRSFLAQDFWSRVSDISHRTLGIEDHCQLWAGSIRFMKSHEYWDFVFKG